MMAALRAETVDARVDDTAGHRRGRLVCSRWTSGEM
jgi:hypothetical protein